MPDKDFIAFNMPAMMGRKVSILRENGEMVRDETWHTKVRRTYFSLFKFFQDNGLLKIPVVSKLLDTDAVVLRFSDLTEEGQAFVMTQATVRWEASFDRLGSKKQPEDVTYLEKQLQKFRAGR